MNEKGMDVTLGSNLPPRVSINSPPNETDTPLVTESVIPSWCFGVTGKDIKLDGK